VGKGWSRRDLTQTTLLCEDFRLAVRHGRGAILKTAPRPSQPKGWDPTPAEKGPDHAWEPEPKGPKGKRSLTYFLKIDTNPSKLSIYTSLDERHVLNKTSFLSQKPPRGAGCEQKQLINKIVSLKSIIWKKKISKFLSAFYCIFNKKSKLCVLRTRLKNNAKFFYTFYFRVVLLVVT
jgi:hypothetical protein